MSRASRSRRSASRRARDVAPRTGDFSGSFAQQALLWLVALKLLGLIVLFSTVVQFGFDLPKSLWSKALEWPMAAILAIALLRHGTAIVPRTRLHVLVAAFVAANVVATVFAPDTYVALFGLPNRYLGLTYVADMAVLYLGLAVALRRRSDWLVVTAAVLIGAGVSLAYATVQYLGLDPVRWGRDPQERPFGTVGNPDMFGHFFAVLAAGAAAAALFTGRRARVVAAVVAAAALAMVLVSGTRGALLADGGALLVLAALWVRAHGLRLSPRLVLGIAGTLLVAALGALASPPGQRLLSARVSDRVLLYETTLRAFAARPLFGWGPDGLGVAWPQFRGMHDESVWQQPFLAIDQAHNWLLQTAVTTGAVGFLALSATIAAVSWTLWRSRATPGGPASAVLLASYITYWLGALTSVESVSVSWIPWAVTGAAVSLTGTRVAATAPAVRRLPAAAEALALAGALLVALTGLNAYRANGEIWYATSAYPAGRADEVVARSSAAVALDGGRADYWNYRGLGREQKQQLAAATADFTEATARAPFQSNYWINLARARTTLAVAAGDTNGPAAAAALEVARRATAADPNVSAPHRAYAETALALGRYDLAAQEALHSLRLWASDPRTDVVLAGAATKLADKDAAERVLEAAVALKDSAPLWAGLAQVRLDVGDFAGARAAASHAVLLDPTNADAKRLLALASQPGSP